MNATAEIADKWIDEALSTLRQQCDIAGTSTMSVLIDPMLADLGAAIATEYELTTHRLPTIHDDLPESKHPYLISMPGSVENRDAVHALMHLNLAEATGTLGEGHRGRSICAWLPGDDQPARTAKNLARLARVRKPNGLPWPLRYWDPRVYPRLRTILDPAQHQTFSALTHRWCVLDDWGNLMVSPPPEQTPQNRGLPLRFTESQWTRLERIALLNQASALVRSIGYEDVAVDDHRLDNLIVRAQRWQLTSDQDVLAFLACGVTVCDQFDQHPAVKSRLTDGLSTGKTAVGILSGIEEQVWRQVQDDAAAMAMH